RLSLRKRKARMWQPRERQSAKLGKIFGDNSKAPQSRFAKDQPTKVFGVIRVTGTKHREICARGTTTHYDEAYCYFGSAIIHSRPVPTDQCVWETQMFPPRHSSSPIAHVAQSQQSSPVRI